MNVSDDYLPVAHTCYNLLDIPNTFSSIEKMKEKIVQAIENSQGFGLV